MTSPLDRLLLEAGSVSLNYRSSTHRASAAREVAQLELDDLFDTGCAKAHLGLAIREAVIGLASLTSGAARAAAANGIASLVRAARSEPSSPKAKSTEAAPPYWLEADR